MLNRQIFRVSLLALVIIVLIPACGIKGDPRGPEHVAIPKITNIKALVDGTDLTLRWKPRLEYSNGEDIELQTVEIYRLQESLQDEYSELLTTDAKRIEEATRINRMVPETMYAKQNVGALMGRLYDLQRIRIEDFSDRATLVDTISVEELTESADEGQVVWSHSHGIQMSDELPMTRYIYAIRQIDTDGKESDFSDYVIVYPFYSASLPEQLVGDMNKRSVLLSWTTPKSIDSITSEVPFSGFNIYKSEAEADTNWPYRLAVKSPAPANWTVDNEAGVLYASEGLQLVSGKKDVTAISQMLISDEDISKFVGKSLSVVVELKGLGEKTPVNAIVDFSRIKEGISQGQAANQDLFDEDENPLITSRKIEAAATYTKTAFTVQVPVDAVAAQIRIEIPENSNLRIPIFIKSVSVADAENGQELVVNGDFSVAEPVQFRDNKVEYDKSYTYKISSVYDVGTYYLESPRVESEKFELRDIYPPATPTSVTALASRQAVSITWDAVADSDLEGYNIYRRILPDGTWVKLTESPVSETIFRDTLTKPGSQYEYRVESVDKRGNESQTQAIIPVTTLSEN